ncbi:MAG: exodeoxyribonuclease VII small subunit [Elusimicrobia bacterium]|nr:exodeoxyribonuclease VII small subunit [Elusimicrobiota bacterium]
MPEVKYSKAMERLEEIISKIENEEVDIDELSEKVKEAVGLIRLCKSKIEKADLEIRDVVADLTKEAEK